jgi:hypothetical protein
MTAISGHEMRLFMSLLVCLSGMDENDVLKFLSEGFIFYCFYVITRLPVFAKPQFIVFEFFYG